jgi:hypothetical protein
MKIGGRISGLTSWDSVGYSTQPKFGDTFDPQKEILFIPSYHLISYHRITQDRGDKGRGSAPENVPNTA